MNEHIALVKKWLADNDSVSSEALRANAEAAEAAGSAAEAAEAAAYAARAADRAADAAAHGDARAVEHWVKRYEELTNAK